MVVRIRFGPGRLVTRRPGKNGKAALLLASLLTLVATSCGALGFWRLGQDLDFTGNFVFSTGLLSHWQVWLAAAAGFQYSSWWLTRYSRRSRVSGAEPVSDSETRDEDATVPQKVTAGIQADKTGMLF
jgi:hypothetical protein